MHCCQLVAECNGPWYSEEGDEAKGRNSVLCKGAQLVRVTNCPWKFWSAGEPDLGLPGLVRGQLGSLASWAEHGPVQWWRGWETKTGRRAKRAKLGRYVATEIKKNWLIYEYGSGSLLLKTLWNSLEKKLFKILFKYFISGFDLLENLWLPTWVWDLASKGVLAKIWGGGGWFVAFDFTAHQQFS